MQVSLQHERFDAGRDARGGLQSGERVVAAADGAQRPRQIELR